MPFQRTQPSQLAFAPRNQMPRATFHVMSKMPSLHRLEIPMANQFFYTSSQLAVKKVMQTQYLIPEDLPALQDLSCWGKDKLQRIEREVVMKFCSATPTNLSHLFSLKS